MAFIPKNNGPSRRLAAMIVDSIIIAIFVYPIYFGLAFAFGISINDPQSIQNASSLIYVLGLLSYIPMYFYTAWFYKNKGGTPGKLLMKLQVIHLKTGGRLGYGTTLLRDIFGKYIISILVPQFGGLYFIISFFVVVFRKKDRRAIHDLIANTQVIYTDTDIEKGL